jgi:hypothetical protein
MSSPRPCVGPHPTAEIFAWYFRSMRRKRPNWAVFLMWSSQSQPRLTGRDGDPHALCHEGRGSTLTLANLVEKVIETTVNFPMFLPRWRLCSVAHWLA